MYIWPTKTSLRIYRVQPDRICVCVSRTATSWQVVRERRSYLAVQLAEQPAVQLAEQLAVQLGVQLAVKLAVKLSLHRQLHSWLRNWAEDCAP